MACVQRAPAASPAPPTTGRPRTQRRARGDARRGRRGPPRAPRGPSVPCIPLASVRALARAYGTQHTTPCRPRRDVLPPGADCRARPRAVGGARRPPLCALWQGAWWYPAPLRAPLARPDLDSGEGGATSSVLPGRRGFFQVERRTLGRGGARRNHARRWARRGNAARGERTATPGCCIWVRGCLKYSVPPPWAACRKGRRPSVRRVVYKKYSGSCDVTGTTSGWQKGKVRAVSGYGMAGTSIMSSRGARDAPSLLRSAQPDGLGRRARSPALPGRR